MSKFEKAIKEGGAIKMKDKKEQLRIVFRNILNKFIKLTHDCGNLVLCSDDIDNTIDELIKEVEKERKIIIPDNINILYSNNGRKGYLMGDKEILEYALPVPFSRDFYNATYIGRQGLIKSRDERSNGLIKKAKKEEDNQ